MNIFDEYEAKAFAYHAKMNALKEDNDKLKLQVEKKDMLFNSLTVELDKTKREGLSLNEQIKTLKIELEQSKNR